MAIIWDTSRLPIHNIMFARRNLSKSGGLSFSGVEQVVQSSTDFWEATLTLKIRKREQRLAYRSYQAQNWGRAGQWLIPTCGDKIIVDQSFGSDFGDDFSTVRSIPFRATITSAAVRGARTLFFQMFETDWVPEAGMYFSIGNRLYLIGTLTALLSPIGAYIATFSPGLRAAAAVGNSMDFGTPRCLMRLAQDNIGQMDMDMHRFADVSLSFLEVPY